NVPETERSVVAGPGAFAFVVAPGAPLPFLARPVPVGPGQVAALNEVIAFRGATARIAHEVGTPYLAIEGAADFDDDGHRDLAGFFSGGPGVAWGRRVGGWDAPVEVAPVYVDTTGIGDFTGDGRPDLVTYFAP